MATESNKLPAQTAGKTAVARAAERVAAPSVVATGAGSFKALVIALAVADVLGIGGWAYMKWSVNSNLRAQVQTMSRRLPDAKRSLELLQGIATKINKENILEVRDPGTLAFAVFRESNLQDSIQLAAAHGSKFGQTEYYEKTAKITFVNKNGYPFRGLVEILQRIEGRNPTVQIRDIDFGKRDLGSPDIWTPTTMTVRAMTRNPPQG